MIRKFGLMALTAWGMFLPAAQAQALDPFTTSLAGPQQQVLRSAPPLAEPVLTAPVAALLAEPIPVATQTRVIKAGQAVSAFLADLARAEGWTLIWEVPDFVVEQTVPIGSDLMRTVSDLVLALVASGTEATAYFYRGNKVIHVTERSK